MPQKKLQDLINESRNPIADASEFEISDAEFERMYEVFAEVRQEISKILCFGPSNSKEVEQLENRLFSKPNLFNKLSSINESDRNAYLAILSRNKVFKEFPVSRSHKSSKEKLRQYFDYGLISGTGTCEVYATIAAVLLCKKYDVDVSIINIHSDLTHTFLKVNTKPAYIFDFWSESLTKEGDWAAWNESHDYAYRYSHEARFTPIMEHIPQTMLNELETRLDDREILDRRNKHLTSLLSHQSFSEVDQSSLEISSI